MRRAGWIAGFCVGVGASSFGWWNPYLALFVFLGGLAMTATVIASSRSGERP